MDPEPETTTGLARAASVVRGPAGRDPKVTMAAKCLSECPRPA
jgi:hypothetical protein